MSTEFVINTLNLKQLMIVLNNFLKFNRHGQNQMKRVRFNTNCKKLIIVGIKSNFYHINVMPGWDSG